ncbi:MAG: helix-turn-helix transcriptional regulator [Opitutus sp.]
MPRARSRQELELLAPEVTRGTYFFLDLVARNRGPVAVALGGHEQCGEKYRVDREAYPFPTLEFVAEGSGQVTYGAGEPQDVRPGSLFAHGPGVKIKIESKAGQTLSKYFVCLTGRGARRLIEAHAPAFGKVLTLAHSNEVQELFELILREGARQTASARKISDHLGRVLLWKISDARLNRGGAPKSPSRETFLRCKHLIDAEGARFATLEEIAGALHADASGLSRLFRRYQGVSPYRYLLRHKMHLAAQDLIRTGDLVKEVAARAGYADAYHFSRVFKAVHGIAPAHFPRLAVTETGAASS